MQDLLLREPNGHLYADNTGFVSICCEHYREKLIESGERIEPILEDGNLRISNIDSPRYGTHSTFNCPFCPAKPEWIGGFFDDISIHDALPICKKHKNPVSTVSWSDYYKFRVDVENKIPSILKIPSGKIKYGATGLSIDHPANTSGTSAQDIEFIEENKYVAIIPHTTTHRKHPCFWMILNIKDMPSLESPKEGKEIAARNGHGVLIQTDLGAWC